MKKVTAALIVIVMLFMTSCATSTDPILSEETNRETESAQNETKPTTEVTTTTSTTTTTTTTSTTTEAKPEFGSRKNPAQFGDTVIVFGTLRNGSEFEYTIEISNLRRGEEAKQIAISNNRYNELPEGQEAIVFDAKFNLSKYAPDDDDSYWTSYLHFDYYASNFTSFRGESLVGSDNEYGGSLYEGGTVAGDVILAIPEGDQGYILFDDFVWYALP